MIDKRLFSLESEIAVLSILLQNPDLIHSSNGLRFYMFSSSTHRALFEEMESLRSRQQTPEPNLIFVSLDTKGELDKIGGKRYLDVLLAKEVNPSTFTEFVEIVVASYKARQLLELAGNIQRDKMNPSNVDEFIMSTKRGLDSITQVKSSLEVAHISELVRSAYEEIKSRRDKPGIRGTTWGSPRLDEATGGKSPGDLWIVGARPGMGKTALVCNSVLEDGKAGVPSLLIEREMRYQELLERLVSIDTGINNTKIRLGTISDDEVDVIYKSFEKIQKYPIYLDTNFRVSDPIYLESTISRYVNNFGVKTVYLDYVQLATERDEGQTQEIGRLTRMFKLLCNELGICSILLSQLNRNVEMRDNKRPMLSDLKMSGALEEDPDFVVGLYRDEHYNPETKNKGLMEYIVLKHRNGPPGTVTLNFNGPTSKISD